MRQIDRIRRFVVENLEKEDRTAKKLTEEEVLTTISEELTKTSSLKKANDEFTVSENAKSIPQSLEENVEVAPVITVEKPIAPKKTFPKKKKE